MKVAEFHPKVRIVIQDFPEGVRRELGKAIFDLQKGEKLCMPLSKTMPSVAVGVEELRMKDPVGIYRVFYYTKVLDRVIVFHAFTKKTQKTPQHEIELAKKRLKEML